jgi:hypothetical protein
MITAKFFESKMFLKVKRNSLMNEIYARIGRWIWINPNYISLNGRLYPGA